MHKDIGKLTLLLPFLVLLLFPLVVQGTTEGRNSLSEDFNAVRVCDNPRIGGDSDNLNFSGGRNEIETGLYYFGIKPNPQQRYVELIDATGELALRKSDDGPPRTWLVTGIGASLYQISTCVDERPLCLAVSAERALSLETCAALRYGAQVWWSIGITIGPGAGGIVMGNDGFGRMDCLEAGESGRLELPTCANSGHRDVTWVFEPARQTPSSPVAASDSALTSDNDSNHDYLNDNHQVRNEQTPDNLAQWYTSQYQNQSNADVVTLAYGIPETDATAFLAECTHSNSRMIVAIVVTDTGSLSSGTQTPIKMTSSSASKTYHGTVADGTTSYPGIRLMIEKEDTLWTDLAKGSALTLESAFGTTLKLGAESGSAAVADFVRLCRA